MTVHAILKMGDPRLLRIAPPVKEFGTPELRTLVADMFETMHAVNGAGLAAPQIGVDLALVIFGFRHNDRYPDAPPVPETVLLNPSIEPLGEAEEEGWEGCLSVPGPARRRAALRPHPLSRLRPRRRAGRARGRRLPRARGAA
jgi:peptide deformylase